MESELSLLDGTWMIRCHTPAGKARQSFWVGGLQSMLARTHLP